MNLILRNKTDEHSCAYVLMGFTDIIVPDESPTECPRTSYCFPVATLPCDVLHRPLGSKRCYCEVQYFFFKKSSCLGADGSISSFELMAAMAVHVQEALLHSIPWLPQLSCLLLFLMLPALAWRDVVLSPILSTMTCYASL